jgi:predicted CoA-binding protein
MSPEGGAPARERPVREIIADFLAEGPYAVAGASNDRAKYGNRVLRAYQHKGWKVFPVNPREPVIEGLTAYPDLKSLPEKPRGVSIITPPAVTERIVRDAADAGARFVWMQPGAESPEAIRLARERGLEVIADGSCFLVETRFRG